jgi:hypothetical protein
MANTPKPVRKTRAAGQAVGRVQGTKKESAAYSKFEKVSDKMAKGAPKPAPKMGGAKPAPKSPGPAKKDK